MGSVSTDRRQGLNSAAAIKVPCTVATTANITLSGLQTVDGVVLVAGDRVLVKDQTTSSENGIYVADTGNWTRDLDFDGAYDAITGTLVMILEGATLTNTFWRLTTTDPVTFGTDNITFTQAMFSDSSILSFIQAGTGAVARTAQAKMRERVSLLDFGAVGDNATDDSAAIQAAIDYVFNTWGGGLVVAPNPAVQYKIVTGISVPYGVTLKGYSQQSTLFNYTGAGIAFTVGSLPGTVNPGGGIEDIGIILATKTSTGIKSYAGVNTRCRDIYIEGYTLVMDNTRTNIGVDVDGVNISGFFNCFENIRCNHMHTGFRTKTSGTTEDTQNLFINCTSTGDVATDNASIGFDFYGGYGSVLLGGNVESCATGIRVRAGAPGPQIASWGMRYESNTVDILMESTSGYSSFRGSTTLSKTKITDNSGAPSNVFEYGDSNQSNDNSTTVTDSSGDVLGALLVCNSIHWTNNKGLVTCQFDFSYGATAGKVANAQITGLKWKCANNNEGGGVVHYQVGGYANPVTVRMIADSYDIAFYNGTTRLTNAALQNTQLCGSITYTAAP